MFEMKLTDPGEGLLEAEIVAWHVAPGDAVKINDIVVEVETAKSIVELPSPFAGIVGELRAAAGDIVDVGTVIMTVLGVGESVTPSPGPDATTFASDAAGGGAGVGAGAGSAGQAAPAASQAPAAPAASQAPAAPAAQAAPTPDGGTAAGEEDASGSILVGYGTSAVSVARRPRKGMSRHDGPQNEQVNDAYGLDDTPSFRADEARAAGAVTAEPQHPPLPRPEHAREQPTEAVTDPVGRPLAKPAVRRLARDLGVDLGTVPGSGAGGAITPSDVAQAATAEFGGRKQATRIPLRGVRRQMVASMTASLQIPQASVWMDVDVTKTVELIEHLRTRREFRDVRISPILVLAKAVCLAMARHPEINSILDLERGEIIVRPDVNLGIAAATRRGLVVPNIKAANELNLIELANALNDLVAKVREGRIMPSDAADGTFTITNVGVFGVEGGTPILNPGESAILLLGTFNRRPWVMGSGASERLEVRSVAKLTLSIDHRVLDGEQASRFLADVASILEDPSYSMMF